MTGVQTCALPIWQKDICDIIGLCLFSEIATDEIISQGKKLVSTKLIKKFRDTNFEDEIINCSKTLGLEIDTIKAVISRIKG